MCENQTKIVRVPLLVLAFALTSCEAQAADQGLGQKVSERSNYARTANGEISSIA